MWVTEKPHQPTLLSASQLLRGDLGCIPAIPLQWLWGWGRTGQVWHVSTDQAPAQLLSGNLAGTASPAVWDHCAFSSTQPNDLSANLQPNARGLLKTSER